MAVLLDRHIKLRARGQIFMQGEHRTTGTTDTTSTGCDRDTTSYRIINIRNCDRTTGCTGTTGCSATCAASRSRMRPATCAS